MIIKIGDREFCDDISVEENNLYIKKIKEAEVQGKKGKFDKVLGLESFYIKFYEGRRVKGTGTKITPKIGRLEINTINTMFQKEMAANFLAQMKDLMSS